MWEERFFISRKNKAYYKSEIAWWHNYAFGTPFLVQVNVENYVKHLWLHDVL